MPPTSYAPLPIDPVLPELLDALRKGSNAVLRAPTGAGKTTRVPPAILDAGLAGSGRIIVLEPRRLAARAAARRIGAERGERFGEEVGYHVRFDKQWGHATRILVVTPGILLRYLQDDPFLEAATVVICDEFHERGLESDLALGLLRHIQTNVRPELRLVAMSATLEVERISEYLGNCPIFTGEGRLFPVEIRYESRPATQSLVETVAATITRLLRETSGDLLAFLPGWNEIRQTAKALEPLAEQEDLLVLPLHGDLPATEQDWALCKQPHRKVVLATNVAETSVTVEGITGVVDTGLARMLVYNPAIGLDRLELSPISRSPADQRAGRAGRTQPGICIRLWSELQHQARAQQTEPEIRRVDLAGAVLQLLSLGEKNIHDFPWLEPPKPAAVEQAFLLLRRLGALSDAALTELGRTLARFPTHPRLGRLLVEGQRLGDPGRAVLAAALLSERDPFFRREKSFEPPPTFSDLLDRLEALEEFERSGRDSTPFGTLNRGSAQFILRARDQLLRSLRQENPVSDIEVLPDSDALGRSLLAAFPDRLARRRPGDPQRGVMVGGRGVKLAPSSGVLEPELFICLDIDASETESWVRMASGIKREWLPPERVTTEIEVEFDAASERVVARKRLRFEELLIEELPASVPDDETAARVVVNAAVRNIERVVPAEDSEAGRFLVRVRCLAQWMPELSLPLPADNVFHELLPWLSQGRKSFAELRQADWLSALRGRFSYAQLQVLDREAPKRIEVPSGSRIALRYELGRPPILAVRIQELFGLRETPRVAGGRIPVLLHLLAPNFRPQQVTDDLGSFWASTYPQVRKELRARYPKHAWPEDPIHAPPERRPRTRT
jgi:ATP-dependent helicase HrpB